MWTALKLVLPMQIQRPFEQSSDNHIARTVNKATPFWMYTGVGPSAPKQGVYLNSKATLSEARGNKCWQITPRKLLRDAPQRRLENVRGRQFMPGTQHPEYFYTDITIKKILARVISFLRQNKMLASTPSMVYPLR